MVKSPNVQRLRIQVPKRDQFPGEGAGMESTTLLSNYEMRFAPEAGLMRVSVSGMSLSLWERVARSAG